MTHAELNIVLSTVFANLCVSRFELSAQDLFTKSNDRDVHNITITILGWNVDRCRRKT